MRIIWLVLKAIVLLCLLLIVIVAGFTFYMSFDRTDTFYVKDTQFSNFNYLYELDEELKKEEDLRLYDGKNVYVHRLARGQGTVYGYRWYSNGTTNIDDETFKKLTIWVADGSESHSLKFDLSNQEQVKIAYTAGGSAWPDSNCSGYFTSGLLLLEKAGSNVSVTVKGMVTPVASRSYDYCGEQEIVIEFSAGEIAFSQLSPWLGIKGEHPYDETHRR